jgi:hypothetical protein
MPHVAQDEDLRLGLLWHCCQLSGCACFGKIETLRSAGVFTTYNVN